MVCDTVVGRETLAAYAIKKFFFFLTIKKYIYNIYFETTIIMKTTSLN